MPSIIGYQYHTALAYDERTGKFGGYEVATATFSHEDAVIEYLVIDGERQVITPEHPFYTTERGWVAAGELRKGDHVQKAHGKYGVAESLRLLEQKQRMYNLTVEDAHTYFVGDGEWLVHNMCAEVVNRVGKAYPTNTDPRTGQPVPFPQATWLAVPKRAEYLGIRQRTGTTSLRSRTIGVTLSHQADGRTTLFTISSPENLETRTISGT